MSGFTPQQIEEGKRQVLEANNLTNAYIRRRVARIEQMGDDVTETETHVNDCGSKFRAPILTSRDEYGYIADDIGLGALTPHMAPIANKTASNYNMGCIAKAEATEKGFTDVLIHDFEGYVGECSGANIFFVFDGALHTPIADRFLKELRSKR